MRKYLHFAVILIFAAGCSQEPPVILEKYQQLNYRDDRNTGKGYDQLSLFLHVEDEDGYEDLEYLYIVQDDAELFWEMHKDQWEYREREGEIWIGSNNFVMADFGPFPEGTYRVILVDKSGERMETEMYVGQAAAPPELPVITEDSGNISIAGRSRQYSLWMYNEDKFIGRQKITGPDIRRDDFEKEDTTRFYLYYYDNEDGRGVVRGPYSSGR